MKRICVYCGHNPGHEPGFIDASRLVGRILAGLNIGLVYGGGGKGMMGALADAALAAGGEVIGVIPEGL
ncbi:MAG: TIGR00730 family Rossman fold protein, partial [Chromatiales bacterium]|nr:TIGR00730 family Rossman fold protein [Chromatiales bacterium]